MCTDSHALVADLFRHESGRLIALLARRAGANRLDVVEDAVQDALLAAMRSWPLRGVPDNPQGWLFTAARNALTDRLRRSRFGQHLLALVGTGAHAGLTGL